MRIHSLGVRAPLRLSAFAAGLLICAAVLSGALAWCWTQAACLASLRTPMRLSDVDAASATWQLLLHGGWSQPAGAFPVRSERAGAPDMWAYVAVAGLMVLIGGRVAWRVANHVAGWRAGSPLGKDQRSLGRRAVERGWVRQRTWARPTDLRRLWIEAPQSGRPYLGIVGGRAGRMLAAEVEVQPMVIAPPRAGKSSGYVVPWLLDHDGPAVVLSTKRDVYEATVTSRARRGRVCVYDPFGDERSATFTPLIPARTWSGAIRTGEALASAAHPDQANAANEFWDKEAASMLAPLLHAAALSRTDMSGSFVGSMRGTSRTPWVS